MKPKKGFFAKMLKSRNGQTLTEYALIVLVVGLAAFSTYAGFGLGVKAFTNNIVTLVTAAR